jgi:type VI secretion system protein
MALTLRVSSHQGQAMGAAATCVLDGGGSIGRAPDNDWVLPDPERFVSSRHAVITFEGGEYVLTDSSTNGTLVNGEEMPRGGRVRLNTGDRLTIGNYEISISVQPAPAMQAPPPSARAPQGTGTHQLGAMPAGDSSVDPLDFFADAPPRPQPRPPAASHDHAAPESEFFPPPQVKPDTARAPGAHVIPENWDETGFSSPAAPNSAPAPPSQTPPPAAAVGQGPAGAGSFFDSPPAPPADTTAGWESAPRPAPGARPPGGRGAPAGAPPAGATSEPPRFPGPAAPSGIHPAGGAEARADQSVAELLRSAGIDPSSVDPSTLASLGQVLRVVIEGLMDVLKARAAIKNEFRVPVTTLQAVENNPLKFSANAEDALFNLFARRGQSYQEPVDAFREAFDDLRAHQVAIMAGLRAAFASLLGKFDPDRLQESFDKGLKRSAFLDVINKTKYWDLYRDTYAELGDGDTAFRRLFGDEFAQAYEEQMQRLTALRNRP